MYHYWARVHRFVSSQDPYSRRYALCKRVPGNVASYFHYDGKSSLNNHEFANKEQKKVLSYRRKSPQSRKRRIAETTSCSQ